MQSGKNWGLTLRSPLIPGMKLGCVEVRPVAEDLQTAGALGAAGPESGADEVSTCRFHDPPFDYWTQAGDSLT